MRVEKGNIVNGIVSYIEEEIIPKISDDKAAQILISVGASAIRSNNKLIDAILEYPLVKALLKDEGDGTYEIENLFGSLRDGVKKYGYFPISIPPIPFVSPTEKTLKFDEKDIEEIKRRIERGA